MHRGHVITATLALLLAVIGGPSVAARLVPEPGVTFRLASTDYRELSEPERLAYVEQRLRNVASALAGGRAGAIPVEAVELVKRELDEYAARVDASGGRATLRTVIERGARVAPRINAVFRAEKEPVVTGLYIAMIESEFADCIEAPSGAKGMFQFLPSTAAKYGLAESDLCDVEKSARAAAAYLRDRKAELGAHPEGAALAVVSYTLGAKKTREAFGKDPWRARVGGVSEEAARYLPMFFAAAIAGENPADFGVATPPLSSL